VILIGQYDSPFVRRVAIAMRLYGLGYEHRTWSTFGDADKLATFNPLRRVPTLALDDGEVLIESFVILDYLDELVGPSKALIARSGEARRKALKVCALATGLADKAVSLLYERILHKETSDVWVARCRAQVSGVLDALEKDRAARKTPYWFGETINHADIAVACAPLRARSPSGRVQRSELSRADRPRGPLRGAAAVHRDRAGADRAELMLNSGSAPPRAVCADRAALRTAR